MKKTITEREADFKAEVQGFIGTYPQVMLDEFFEYWTEPNKSGSKMRWEREATWDLKRRLSRWANNGFGQKSKGITNTRPKINTQPKSEIEALDEALMAYQKHPTHYEPKQLAKFYEFLKAMRLLRQFTKGEIQEIQRQHGHDIEMCRGVCVMQTFLDYANHLINFSDMLKLRQAVAEKRRENET